MALDRVKAMELVNTCANAEDISFLYQLLKLQRVKHGEKAKSELRTAMRAGQKVRTSAATRPEYMANKIGTLRKINTTTAVIDFDEPTGRFFRGVRVPLTMIEAVLEDDGGR